MLATERRPPPDQFRGSATLRLATVVSSQPMMWTIVPFGSRGA